MKPLLRRRLHLVPILLAALALAIAPLSSSAATSPPPGPEIRSVQLAPDGLHLSIEVPAGLRRIVIESTQRTAPGGWIPREVRRLDGSAQSVLVTLPAHAPQELIRVRADETDPLPAAFYAGRTNIPPVPIPSGGPVLYRSDGTTVVDLNVPTGNPSQGPTVVDRTVAESDIWKTRGQRLYFFNQYRGLQVIDVAQPDAPKLLGSLRSPAAGEQLYAPDDQHVVLLLREDCRGNGYQGAAVLIVDVSADQPREVARLAVPGRLYESRMVGDALYVASQVYELTDAATGVWGLSTTVSSFDLANPAAPVARDRRSIPGNATVVAATPSYFFVGLDISRPGVPRATDLHVLDITAPDGSVAEFTTLPLSGWLRDKFKLDVQGDVLRLVVEDQDSPDRWSPITRLTTWRLDRQADAAHRGEPLGKLDLGKGENLFGTRFDGNRAYVVTFRNTDPLWIVDLSNPEQPRVLGELQIPGWSNYLHPLGDRLLTVGIDNTSGQRAAVQLFDVADPAKPSLLSKIPLGDSWSWSEANSDEKALQVLPDIGLILIPYAGVTQNTSTQGVQLIDLGRDRLQARGLIAHETFTPRRSTLVGNRALSISGQELVVADLTDRDAPRVTARLALAPTVERLEVDGTHLIVAEGNTVSVSTTAAPDISLSSRGLGNLPLLGLTRRDDRLFVLQGTPASTLWTGDASGTNWIISTNAGTFQLRTFSLANLPNLQELGTTTTQHPLTFSGDFEPIWPSATTLVWATLANRGYFGPWLAFRSAIGPVEGFAFNAAAVDAGVALPVDIAPGRGFWWGGWGWGSPRLLVAFDVADPLHPQFGATVTSDTGAYGGSAAFAADGLVLFSQAFQESSIVGTNEVTWQENVYVPVTNRVVRTNVTYVTQVDWITNQVKSVDRHPAVRATWSTGATSLRVAGGAFHTLLTDGTGSVWSWGDTVSRWNSDGSLRPPAVPERVPVTGSFQAVAAGTWHSLGLDSQGIVWSWLSTEEPVAPPVPGEEPPPRALVPPPAPVAGLPPAQAIAAGHQHSLALVNHRVWGWGDNSFGQAGLPTLAPLVAPTEIPGLSARQIAAGAFHSLVLTSEGKVLAFGRNDALQLGSTTTKFSAQPIEIPLPGPAVAVTAGAFHGAALLADGSVWTWGGNGAGQLGRADSFDDPYPRLVAGLPPVQQLVAGGQFTLALDTLGSVWLWGELDGTEESRRYLPGSIPELEGAIALAAGRQHALATFPDSTLVALGYPGSGQLGTGEDFVGHAVFLLDEVTPVKLVTTVTNVVEVDEVTSLLVTRNVTNSVPIVQWWQRNELRVVDFGAGATDPVQRPAVAFPGELRGVAQHGTVLFSTTQKTEGTTNIVSRDLLEVSAYDGVNVYVGESHTLSVNGEPGTTVHVLPTGHVAVTESSWSDAAKNRLRILALNEARLTPLADVPIAGPVQNAALRGATLLLHESTGFELFDLSTPGQPQALPGYDQGCIGYDLGRAAGSTASGWWVPGGVYGALQLGPR